MMTALGSALKTIAPYAINYGVQRATQYLSKRLGDPAQSGPAKTLGDIKEPVKDTFGNLQDIQQRLVNIEQQWRNKERRGVRPRVRSRSVVEREWEDDYEEEPRKMFKNTEYEAPF